MLGDTKCHNLKVQASKAETLKLKYECNFGTNVQGAESTLIHN